MKKVFSYLLALTLLVSTMSVSLAAPADVTDKGQERAVDILMALGVVNGYEDGTYKPANPITRAEMAKMIVTALGYKNYADGASNSFTDMDAHWAKGYVEVCAEKGVLKGYDIAGTDKREFKPDNQITYDEAATVLLRALGYTDEVLTGSAWPLNYYTKAKSEGIYNDVNYAKTAANRGDIALMLYNSLNLPIGTSKDGEYTATVLSTDADGKEVYDTMFARLKGARRALAVVSGDENVSFNIRDKVASLCEIYENTETKEDILFVELSTKLKGKFNADLEGFVAVDGKDYLCEKTLASLDADKEIEVFYNGQKSSLDEKVKAKTLEELAKELVAAYDKADKFDDMNLEIAAKIAGKTLKELYSVSVWDISKAGLARASVAKDLLNNKLLGLEFKTDENKEIDVNSFELLGVEKLEDIKEGDVVYVYADDTYIRRVEVGTEVLKDVAVESLNADMTEITLEGKTYMMSSDQAFASMPYAPKSGDKINVKLDFYGNVYWAELSPQYAKFALLKKFEVVGEKTKLDLILAQGKDEKTDAEYEKLSSGELVSRLYPDIIKQATGQLYKVSYDNKDEVCKIEKAKENVAKLDKAKKDWYFKSDSDAEVRSIDLSEYLDTVKYDKDGIRFARIEKKGAEPEFLAELKIADDFKYIRQNEDKSNADNNIYMKKTEIAFKGVFTSKTMKMKNVKLYDVDNDGVYDLVVYKVEKK